MKRWIMGLGFLGMAFLQAGEELDMKSALETLYPKGDKSFVFAASELKKSELFAELKVNQNISIKCVGKLDCLRKQLVQAMCEMGNNGKELAEEAADELVELTNRVLDAEGYKNGVVMFRAFIANDLFHIPRWHMDGNFFKPWGQNPPKFVITLKGPGTLFQPSNCNREFLFNLDGPRQIEQDRQKVALRFLEAETIKTKTHQGAFFIVGNDHAAVHSEPDITEERIFISIMGATDEQIQEMIDRGF